MAQKEKNFRLAPGRRDRFERLPVVEMYDPITDTWAQKADMPVWRDGGTCVVDGKIYIIGGVAGNREEWRLDIVDVYDPATDTWAKAKSMNHARSSASVSVVDGKIYVMGGNRMAPRFPIIQAPSIPVLKCMIQKPIDGLKKLRCLHRNQGTRQA